MKLLAVEPDVARARYTELMAGSSAEPLADEIRPNGRHARILGDETFVARVLGAAWKPRARKTLEELISECEWRFGITADLLKSGSKASCVSSARAWIAHEAVDGRVATVSAVARRLNRSESSIRELMSRRPRQTSGK